MSSASAVGKCKGMLVIEVKTVKQKISLAFYPRLASFYSLTQIYATL